MASAVTSMSKQGEYKASSVEQSRFLDFVAPIQQEALKRVCRALQLFDAPPAPQLFNIADFGSADGGNSARPVALAIQTVRAAFPDIPICVTHCDLPNNDWSFLFAGLQEPTSYLFATPPQADGKTTTSPTRVPGVFSFASATSFHSQVFPPGSLHFGFCASAAHWTSEAPQLKDHVDYDLTTDKEGAQRYRDVAEKDWLNFIRSREAELATGGRVVINMNAVEKLGDPRPMTQFNAWQEAILKAWQSQGKITAEEHRAFVVASYSRSLDEIRKPFLSGATKLQLETMEYRVMPSIFKIQYREHKDAQRAADAYLKFMRGIVLPVWKAALRNKTEPERASLIDGFCNEIKALFIRDIETSNIDYAIVVLVLAKSS